MKSSLSKDDNLEYQKVILKDTCNQFTFNKLLSFTEKLDFLQSFIYFIYDNDDFHSHLAQTLSISSHLKNSLNHMISKLWILSPSDQSSFSIVNKIKHIFRSLLNQSMPLVLSPVLRLYPSIPLIVSMPSDQSGYRSVNSAASLLSCTSGYSNASL